MEVRGRKIEKKEGKTKDTYNFGKSVEISCAM
jgi:hypothetical protein